MTLDLVGTGQPSRYGTWLVPIDTLAFGQNADYDVGSFAAITLVDASGSFDPSANGTSPRSGKRGYRIDVTGAQMPNADVLNVTVRDPEQIARLLNTEVVGSLPAVRSLRSYRIANSMASS